MRSSRFNQEQIIGKIKEREAGMPTAKICRKHRIRSATFYTYNSKLGELEISGAPN